MQDEARIKKAKQRIITAKAALGKALRTNYHVEKCREELESAESWLFKLQHRLV